MHYHQLPYPSHLKRVTVLTATLYIEYLSLSKCFAILQLYSVISFKIKLSVYLLRSQVSLRMACEAPLLFERFITAVALEWFLPSVLPHVVLQSARSSASVIALVTLERLFTSVLSHDVNFQICSCIA